MNGNKYKKLLHTKYFRTKWKTCNLSSYFFKKKRIQPPAKFERSWILDISVCFCVGNVIAAKYLGNLLYYLGNLLTMFLKMMV